MTKLVALVALVFGIAGCAGKSAQGVQPNSAHNGSEATEAQAGDDPQSCPMRVPGVAISYEDTADGAAIVFSSEPAQLSDLQARVARMAERHNRPAGEHEEEHVAHAARAENNEKGARLAMTPTDPSQLEALRAHVRDHVGEMQSGECPMMKHGHGHHGAGHGPS